MTAIDIMVLLPLLDRLPKEKCIAVSSKSFRMELIELNCRIYLSPSWDLLCCVDPFLGSPLCRFANGKEVCKITRQTLPANHSFLPDDPFVAPVLAQSVAPVLEHALSVPQSVGSDKLIKVVRLIAIV